MRGPPNILRCLAHKSRLSRLLRPGPIALTILTLSVLPFLVRTLAETKAPKTATSANQKEKLARLNETVSVRAADRGHPTINLSDGHELLTSYVGPAELRMALEQNQAEPLSLASADFDEDGVPDLVTGYSYQGQGIVSVLRGNVDSIYPNAPEAKQHKAAGTFTNAPFLAPANVFAAPVAVDFIGAGDFDADGHWDVAVASTSQNALYLLSGDGRGRLSLATQSRLPGVVTAMTTGEVNRADGLTDIVLGIQGSVSEVLVFEGPEGALRASPEILEMPGAVTSLQLAQLNGDYTRDVAIAAGDTLVIVRGRDRKLSLDETARAKVSPALQSQRHFESAISAIAVGNFAGDPGIDVAVGTSDGLLQVIDLSSTIGEGSDTWSTETIRTDAVSGTSRLTVAGVSTSAYDDLVIYDNTNRRLQLLQSTKNTQSGPLSADPFALEVDSEPVAIVPARLTSSALDSLIVLRTDQVAPTIATIEPHATFTVTNTNASGLGSLQFAILDANETPGADVITFNIPGAGPHVINHPVPLPTVTDPVTIDATTQPGFAGTPVVELKSDPNTDGLTITSANCSVRGLATYGFRYGLKLEGNANNSIIEGNWFGYDLTGSLPIGVQSYVFTANNIIGGTVAAARNLFTGLWIEGRQVSNGGNLVRGNFFNMTPDGTAGIVFGLPLLIESSSGNAIGGTVAGARNIINDTLSIERGPVINPTSGNLVQGNYIGTDVTGTVALANPKTGVSLRRLTSNNTIGGTAVAARNIISGSTQHGVLIGSANNLVQGNYIGTDVNGAADLGSAQNGIIITSIDQGDATGNTVGGTAAGARNVISGNGLSGVLIEGAQATGNFVQGNFIGTNAAGSGALGNDLNGVSTSQAPNNTIGGSTTEARNIISGNARHGVSIGIDTNSGATGITVQNNYIGTDITGNNCLGNLRDGVFVNRGSVNHTIIDNLITCNGRDGVNIPNFATNDPGIQIQVIQNLIYGNAGLGINLGDAGITPNDPQDADGGANFQQNFPELTSFSGASPPESTAVASLVNDSGLPNPIGTDTLTINGTLNSAPNQTFTVHWYFSAAAQCVTNQAASRPLITGKVPGVTTNAGGAAQFQIPFDFPAGINSGIINCTATDAQGNTSEFSACLPVDSSAPSSRTLTVASANPNSGVNITVSPNDNNAAGNGATQFTRVYNLNTVVNLIAPATASGNSFQKWLRDGADFANNTQTNASVTMDAAHTMTAVYTTPQTIQLDSLNYTAAENVGSKVITVTRTGDTTGTATVNYTTSDTAGSSNCNVLNTGKASSRCDYITTVGTLSFAVGETSKQISIPIIDDAYAEGSENFSVTLTNPIGTSLGSPNSAPVTITDNESQNGSNPIVQARYYVRVHYLDFLNREPDTSGWDFWTNQITACGSDVGCTEVRRVDVSASFFLSIEFQQTGYLVERTYKAAYGDATGNSNFGGAHSLTVPVVRFDEFLADTQQITRGVVVLQPGWEQLLESNKVVFFNEFVQRTRFTAAGAFPPSMTAPAFVDQLNTRAGNPLSAAERNQLVSDLTTGTRTRAQVLRAVTEHPNLVNAEFNRAFVLMQYFGYLRRNPNDPQDSDYTGYDFWLVKLNQFGGNYINAEMVKAFITSIEYKGRFGP